MTGLMRETRTDAEFAAFLAQTRARTLTFLRRLCGADYEDVLQETHARLWRYRAGWDRAKNGEGWALRAAFRAFLDWRQRRARAPASDDASVRGAVAPARVEPELAAELERGLAKLPLLERALLVEFHQDGCSLAELARRHRLPLNTVKSHLHRARKRLAEAMG